MTMRVSTRVAKRLVVWIAFELLSVCTEELNFGICLLVAPFVEGTISFIWVLFNKRDMRQLTEVVV